MTGDETVALPRGAVKTAPLVAFLVALAGAWGAFAQPPAKVARIGMLVTGPPPGEHVCVQAFRRGLADLGYVEGRTHILELRWDEKGQPEETFPRFGADLVRLKVDLIVSVTAQGLPEARNVIASVPVVMAAASYPEERRLISSLARPGGNITGLATFTGELHAKRLELFREALPGLSRVTVLRVAGDQSDAILRHLERTAQLLGIKLQVIEVNRTEDFASAFQAATLARAQAVMTTQSPFFYQNLRVIADLALRHRLPSLTGEPTAAEA